MFAPSSFMSAIVRLPAPTSSVLINSSVKSVLIWTVDRLAPKELADDRSSSRAALIACSVRSISVSSLNPESGRSQVDRPVRRRCERTYIEVRIRARDGVNETSPIRLMLPEENEPSRPLTVLIRSMRSSTVVFASISSEADSKPFPSAM